MGSFFIFCKVSWASNSSVCTSLCENNWFFCEFEDYQFSLKLLCTKGTRNKEPHYKSLSKALVILICWNAWVLVYQCVMEWLVIFFIIHHTLMRPTMMCDKIMNEISSLFVVAYQMYLGPKNSNSAQKVPIENDDLSLNFWVQDTFDMLPQLGWKLHPLFHDYAFFHHVNCQIYFKSRNVKWRNNLNHFHFWQFETRGIWGKTRKLIHKDESKSLLPYHEFGYHNSGA